MSSKKTGVLLVNIGSPENLNIKDVRIYLRKFLSDPKVIDLPFILRKILVNLFIVPFRSKNTLKAYEKIWTKDGSPLVLESINLRDKLASSLGSGFHVAIGMSYSQPSLRDSIQEIIENNCNEVIVVPLYPQYAEATNGSVISECKNILSKYNKIKNVKFIEYFYNNEYYLNSLQKTISNKFKEINNNYDFILFSYHGLPERQLQKVKDPSKCYKEHCYKTTHSLVELLNINNMHATSFQSRLGRIPWIKPYTDEMLIDLSKKGIKNLVIVCPSFVIDCLETLEEIGIQAKNEWKKLGGENFYLVPCLNSNSDWVDSLINIIIKY